MKTITKLFTWMLTGIISALGFTACNNDELDLVQVMYGCPLVPYINYNVAGDVKDDKGEMIPNARVIFTPYYNSEYEDMRKYDITITPDQNGHYSAWCTIKFPETSVRLICSDTADEYENDTVYVYAAPIGGSGKSNLGTATINQNFTLKKKSNNE